MDTLGEIVAAWPSLTAENKATILAIVRGAPAKGEPRRTGAKERATRLACSGAEERGGTGEPAQSTIRRCGKEANNG